MNEFMEYLEKIYDACGQIKDAGGCDRCPIRHNCIDDTPVAEFASFCTKRSLKEFLDLADDVEQFANEQDYDDYHEWLKAETEREKWLD